VPTPGVDFAGRPLDRSPKWSGSAGLDYTIPVGEGKVVASAKTRFSSRYELTDQGNFAYFFQPSYTKSDLALTYSAPSDRFFVSAYVHNLEDRITVTNVTAGFFGNVNFADPRVFGARAGIKF
jgi:iron complex outermembrane receptor protein